ncbi:MAG TPA: transporter substrate-binding domain-containing protein [Accumulibacter sp.]|uniref:transporter substrate-binding domain-containing protein n=1 Tax=Accumulibacter sp. TaxID=2053492 RepID=UPI0025FF64EB|nr:transporter substrate-binding domain-containing protein [Accumulibacter sp.]MCM8598604.1 transporter substrate-binding domain-containing protein [Accumulibacter sp.]MCM8663220.1 transporter substrate-binding domain-containing protein [Accumulibacter sp.]HNC52756.1 transporter substrate-binding domain-containing protein [Accumulibacter sp.]
MIGSWFAVVASMARPLGWAGILVVTTAAGVLTPIVGAAAPAQTRPALRVATSPIAPFVLKQDGQLSGFSIDLWEALAKELAVDFSWIEFTNANELLAAVERGDADVAIAAITMTPERDKIVDFSHPFFDSGLQIMVRTQEEEAFLATLQSIVSPAVRHFVGAAIAILFVLANILWLIERQNNPRFQQGYLRGVLEGLWGVTLIIATGEHGDRDAPGVLKRLTVACMWLLGVVLVAQFTATVTSLQTVHQLHSNIRGPGDLPGKTIATKAGTTVADYLDQLRLPYVELTSAQHGCEMLLKGQVQAIVFDAPTLHYWVSRCGHGRLQVVGPLFRLQKYGIAVAAGSRLRKQINETLLTLYANGTYEEIYQKWFAETK